MAQIQIIGDALGCSGYSAHTRELANALNELIPVRLTTNLYPGCEKDLNDKELEMIKRQPVDDEINLIITVPHQWKLHTGPGKNICYCVWEGDKVPESFIEEFLNPDIDYIIVPSTHTQQAILSTLHNECGKWCKGDNFILNDKIIPKIKIIHHGVDLKKFYPNSPQSSMAVSGNPTTGINGETEDTFTFLCNKGFRNLEDRGGIQYAIKAYLEEFTKEDNVNLILKINPAYGIPDLNKLITQLKPEGKTNFAPINIIADNIPYTNLVKLYNQCDVFVSPTRCEGFNLPCLEALACGKPVITSNFGGQTDFCNEENGWIVGGKLEEVTWETMYEGISWLTIDIKELRATMRKAYESKDLLRKSNCAKQTSEKFTWKHTAEKIYSLTK